MKYFESDTNWIFTFCKVCWDFKKFIFDKPINFDEKKPQYGKCTKCEATQAINLNDAKAYYEELNKENN